MAHAGLLNMPLWELKFPFTVFMELLIDLHDLSWGERDDSLAVCEWCCRTKRQRSFVIFQWINESKEQLWSHKNKYCCQYEPGCISQMLMSEIVVLRLLGKSLLILSVENVLDVSMIWYLTPDIKVAFYAAFKCWNNLCTKDSFRGLHVFKFRHISCWAED